MIGVAKICIQKIKMESCWRLLKSTKQLKLAREGIEGNNCSWKNQGDLEIVLSLHMETIAGPTWQSCQQ